MFQTKCGLLSLAHLLSYGNWWYEIIQNIFIQNTFKIFQVVWVTMAVTRWTVSMPAAGPMTSATAVLRR